MATSDGFAARLFLIYATGNVCFEFTMQLFGMENCCKICQAVSLTCSYYFSCFVVSLVLSLPWLMLSTASKPEIAFI